MTEPQIGTQTVTITVIAQVSSMTSVDVNFTHYFMFRHSFTQRMGSGGTEIICMLTG